MKTRNGKVFVGIAVVVLIILVIYLGRNMFFRNEEAALESATQEVLEFPDIDLKMILPESWKEEYSVAENGQNYVVYCAKVREEFGGSDLFDGGVLFTVVCYEEPMTEQQFVENGLDYTGYRYIMATDANTYILRYASDVQYDLEDKAQEELYHKMSGEIKDIQFTVDK